MNLQLLAGSAVAAFALASCSAPEPPPTEAPTPADAKAMTYAVDPANSTVEWSGNMVGVMGHSGTLRFSAGSITAKNGQLIGGDFTVDMKSLATTDTGYAKPGSKQGTHEMFMGHMMSPDFFAVDSFPTAHFKVSSVDGNTATGELTVRGKTNTEQVKDILIDADSTGITASGTLVFDRQKYGVAWKSPVKDMVLSNDIDLSVHLIGTAQ
jgi:polyisoprenoid-binding protein YceI